MWEWKEKEAHFKQKKNDESSRTKKNDGELKKIFQTNAYSLETNELIPPNRHIFSLISNRIRFHASALD